jgi:inosose dehydratase
MQAVAASIFPELGKGDVDFPALVANLEKQHYEGWGVVEQDLILGEGSSPLSSATRNRAYLRSIGL